MKKLLALILSLMLVLGAMPAMAAGSLIEDVWLECEVVAKGHKMKAFHLTVTDPAVFETLTKADFKIVGKSGQWGTDALHTFTADVGSVAVDGNNVTLKVINFNEKYFYVDNYTVLCTDARLTFTREDLSKEVTPVVEDFEEFRVSEGAPVDYNLFTPADTTVAQPLVLALHGAGDYLNLVQNRVVTGWAEPYNQSVRPCYVMGPLFQNPDTQEWLDSSDVIAKSVAVIQGMIDEGKVDPNRIYVTGKSMGGGNTVRAMLEHPDFFAAGMPMCPAFSTDGVDISPLKDQKIWIMHSDGDTTVKPERVQALYDAIVALGGENIALRMFTAKEMNVLGYDEYHAVDMQVYADETYLNWLYSQVKE